MLRFGFPITSFRKLEDGRLEVEGLASDETIDSQGDIVDFDGLRRAAESWRGNIREQHDPKKAVGRALEVKFDDQKRAMFVRSFISKGAPETQEKVIDGTLRSYSVGGSNPSKVTYEKVGDRTVRRVLEWDMSELSLVDAPANPNANFELVKADGATDLIAEDTDNRFGKALLDALEKGKDMKKQDAAPAAEAPAPAPVEEPKAEEPKPETPPEASAPEKAAEPEQVKAEEPAAPAADAPAEKAAPAPEVKKSMEAFDINAALEILLGLESLLYNETTEPESEPPAQRGFLTSAIAAVKGFIASEAGELAAEPDDAAAAKAAGAEIKKDDGVAMCMKCGGIMRCAKCEKGDDGMSMSALADMVKGIDERVRSLDERYTKTSEATASGVFKVNDGDQLAEGIGKGLSVVNEAIAKANADLKGLFESEVKGIRESIAELSKTAAVPAPLRTVPREMQPAAQNNNSGADVLERALASTTHPETQAFLRAQIALTKAIASQR